MSTSDATAAPADSVAYAGSIKAPPSTTAATTFHRLPDALPAPDAIDETGHGLSAYVAPRQVVVAADVAGLSTLRLTDEIVASVRAQAKVSGIKPQGRPATAVVYTPAQIRAAYGLPVLPTSYSNLSASAAASLGAGQTVYVVDAYDDPNAASDLAVFSAKFGLPTCSTVAVAPTATLPLAAAPTTGCAFSKVYTSASSPTMTATAPAYNSGWAGEIALDIEWAHAIAPLARIVLIESPDAGISSLTGAVTLAGTMGPGSVSMSWATAEASWELSYDSVFTAAAVTYFAATGDSGAQVNWPAISPNVVAVGGTTLSYSGAGSRSESAWSGAGGGTSLYEVMPSWQKTAQPNGTYRMASDVSFNANPNSGQYVYLTAPGATSGSWYAYGGTSLSTPQWAAIVSVANAQRATFGKAPFGNTFLSALYTKDGVGTVNYSANFLDVKTGSDGTCKLCTATTGYDVPTGQGTPNVGSLLPQLQAN